MTNYNSPAPQQESGYGTATVVLGIVAIVFAVILPIIAYLTLLAGLIVSLVASSKHVVSKRLRIGRILLLVAVVVAVINSVLGVILLNQ